jgi:hypothetical protein
MGLFHGNNGDVSSKRIIGATIIAWVMVVSTWYIKEVQTKEGKESDSTENILITSLSAACLMITGGVLDTAFNKKSSNKKIKKDEYEGDD